MTDQLRHIAVLLKGIGKDLLDQEQLVPGVEIGGLFRMNPVSQCTDRDIAALHSVAYKEYA